MGDFSVEVVGTSYSLDGTNSDLFEIDSEGILTIKSEAVTNLQIQELVLEEPEALEVIVKADIPGEPQVTSDKILFKEKCRIQ